MRGIFLFISMCMAALSYGQDTARVIAGTYKGKLPCEECKEIVCELELRYGTDTSGEFAMREKYINPGGTNVASRVKGEWMMKNDVVNGNKCVLVVLDYDNEEKIRYYLLKNDGNLTPLDNEKHAIKADIDCTLKKTE